MSNSIPISDTALSTDHLILRRWTPPELDAVVGGERLPHWAEDFPTDGDRVIAGVVAQQSGTPAASGHRVIVERESGVVVGSTSLRRRVETDTTARYSTGPTSTAADVAER